MIKRISLCPPHDAQAGVPNGGRRASVHATTVGALALCLPLSVQGSSPVQGGVGVSATAARQRGTPPREGALEAAQQVERFLVARGAIHLEVLAQGRGPVVVILPSRGRGAEDYDVIAPRIAATGFRVVRPQPRGVGGSAGPLDKLSLHDLAADVAAVIEHQSKVPVLIVGHAYGNWVARAVASDHPRLVKALVLAAAASGRPTHVPPGMRGNVDTSADMSLPENVRLKALATAFFAPGNDPKVWLKGWSTAAAIAQRDASDATPVDDWFAGGTVPILDLQAEFDVFRPRQFANALKDELGDRVEIQIIRRAGHALVPERPEEVVRAIVDFARRY